MLKLYAFTHSNGKLLNKIKEILISIYLDDQEEGKKFKYCQ